MPTRVLPVGPWCYKIKVPHLRLITSLNPRMLSSLNLFFLKKTSIEKKLSYTESTINSSESSNVELRKCIRMSKATNFSDDFYIFLAEKDPQTFTETMIS